MDRQRSRTVLKLKYVKTEQVYPGALRGRVKREPGANPGRSRHCDGERLPEATGRESRPGKAARALNLSQETCLDTA